MVKTCPHCGARVTEDATHCESCGIALNPYATPRAAPERHVPASGESDATGGVIPYKNPAALVAYYCGVFSLIPCTGLVLGLLGVIFGILGWRNYRRNPACRGQAHAWIGMILGGGMLLAHLVLLALIIIASIAAPPPMPD